MGSRLLGLSSPWRRSPMPVPPSSPADAAALEPDDWRRIRDALLYLGRDLHHRSFAVHASRRELLWQEMDRCLALAERIETTCPLPEPTGADSA